MGEIKSQQIGLFDGAVTDKKRGRAAFEAGDFEAARYYFNKAHALDPCLSDLSLLQNVANLLSELIQKNGRSKTGLIRSWKTLVATRCRGEISAREFALAERPLCQLLLQKISEKDVGYLDGREQSLHIGYCYLVLNDFRQAHHLILDYLTTYQLFDARLWGYLGDCAWQLEWYDEARLDYLRALFIDPLRLDYEKLAYPDLKNLYRELKMTYPDEAVAESLIPIFGWLNGLFTIPQQDGVMRQYVARKHWQQRGTLPLTNLERYRRFAQCLFLDQSRLQPSIDFELRIEMQQLAPKLFQQYLNKL